MSPLKRFILFLFFLISMCRLHGQALMTGDIAFVGFNTDGDDDFAIVLNRKVTATNQTIIKYIKTTINI